MRAKAMSATHWYLLGCASGALAMLIVGAFALVSVWPDLKVRYRGRG